MKQTGESQLDVVRFVRPRSGALTMEGVTMPRQRVERLTTHEVDLNFQLSRMPCIIGIEEGHELPSGGIPARISRCARTTVLVKPDPAQAGAGEFMLKLLQNERGIIPGGIVDDNNLQRGESLV